MMMVYLIFAREDKCQVSRIIMKIERKWNISAKRKTRIKGIKGKMADLGSIYMESQGKEHRDDYCKLLELSALRNFRHYS